MRGRSTPLLPRPSISSKPAPAMNQHTGRSPADNASRLVTSRSTRSTKAGPSATWPAVLMAASWPLSIADKSLVEAAFKSDWWTVALARTSAGSLEGVRTMTETSWFAARAWRTTCRPKEPVAPKTTTFDIDDCSVQQLMGGTLRPTLHAINAIVLHSYTVANAQVDVAGVFHDQRATRIELHRDPVTRSLHLLLLDFVADDRAADGARDRRGVLAAPAADRVADDTTRDAADQGPDVDGLVVGATIDFDGLDLAVIDADR